MYLVLMYYKSVHSKMVDTGDTNMSDTVRLHVMYYESPVFVLFVPMM